MPDSSPRQILRAAFRRCLERITQANGFATDAGLAFTLEPDTKLATDVTAVLTVLVSKQERPGDAGLVRAKRLTTCVVVVKVPASLDEAQDHIDAIVGDVEQAMEGQHAQFPIGYDYPQYRQMEPLRPEAGTGWVGAIVTYQSLIPIK